MLKITSNEEKENPDSAPPTPIEEKADGHPSLDQWIEAIRIISTDPVIFCNKFLELKPFPYQEKLLRDTSKRIVVCAGRQTGKSLITSGRALWFAITHPRTTTLIVSATQRQSMLMFKKVLNHVESSLPLRPSVLRKTRTEITFTNGSEICALPCGEDGNTLRGYTASLIIVDEAAFVPENVITEVVMPMLATTDGTAILISTPFDKDHIFFKVFTNPSWSKHHFKTSDNPLTKQNYLDEQRELAGERKFGQEFLAEFVDDDKTYFPMSLLRENVHVCSSKAECEYCAINSEQQLPSGELYAGYDPGGLADFAALVVVQRIVDPTKLVTYRVVLTRTFVLDKKKDGKKKDDRVYTAFTAEVKDVNDKLHFRRLLVDSTGLGGPILEHCRELKLPAEGLKLTSETKEEVMSNMRLLLEKRQIVLPDDLELLSHLSCITVERTRSAGYVFDHLKGTHDDLAYALALALYTARKPPPTVIANIG